MVNVRTYRESRSIEYLFVGVNFLCRSTNVSFDAEIRIPRTYVVHKSLPLLGWLQLLMFRDVSLVTTHACVRTLIPR